MTKICILYQSNIRSYIYSYVQMALSTQYYDIDMLRPAWPAFAAARFARMLARTLFALAANLTAE
jgi:hypothetical protein